MRRRLWLLRGWLSGWWLEKRCAWGGHQMCRYSMRDKTWYCRCRAESETDYAWIQRVMSS